VWCRKRCQGGEEETLSGGVRARDSAATEGRKMSESPSESLGSGALVCPYQPFCKEQNEAWQCVRLVYMSAEPRRAIDIVKRVCLVCRAQGVQAGSAASAAEGALGSKGQ